VRDRLRRIDPAFILLWAAVIVLAATILPDLWR
jgi:hypothetical protein